MILVDDKDPLGGKLVLQTHKFFGSMADCYVGTRGRDIAKSLVVVARKWENITIMTDSVVEGVFADGKAAIYQPQEQRYLLVYYAGVYEAPGARERN